MSQAAEQIARQFANGANVRRIWSDIIYNVKSYNALGDGTTDDTTFIQAAITAASSAGGGIVYFPTPDTEYLVTATLNVPANVTLQGTGYGVAKIKYTGTGAAVSINGDRCAMKDLFINGSGENNPANDSGQVGILVNSASHFSAFNTRVLYVGRGVQVYSAAVGTEGHYNNFYSCEIRHCYKGITTEDSVTFTGEMAFYGGRISACYLGFYSDANGGDIRFVGTAFEGGHTSTSYLVDVQGGSNNAFFGCRFEVANAGEPSVRVGSSASHTSFYGNYTFTTIEDYSTTTIKDRDSSGTIFLARRGDLAESITLNLIPNGDLKGGLRGYSGANATATYVQNGGMYGDGQTITPTLAGGNVSFSVAILEASIARNITVTIRYKRNGGGSQQVRLRVDSPTGGVTNARDSTSTGWTTLTLTKSIPAEDTSFSVFIYPDEVATETIILDSITANWGPQPVNGQARMESSSVPSQGSWVVGEVIYNSSPTNGKNVGWICTVAGDFSGAAPTFQEFGNNQLKASTTWNPSSISAQSSASTTVTVAGASAGDFVRVTSNLTTYNGMILTATVSSADTVTIIFHNPTSGAVDLGGGTYFVKVEKY